jgi:hypothetical protein
MTGIGDSTPVATNAETVVYFARKNRADQAAAEAVAKSLSGSVITALGPTVDGAQVTVVTGTQFSVNAPPAAASAAAAAAPPSTAPTTTAPTTTTTSTAPADAAFQAPTPAVTPLQPWDPRSCTASGGPGH